MLGGVDRIDVGKMQQRIDSEKDLRDSLQEVGLGSAVSLLATYGGNQSDLEYWLRDAEINRDRNLRLQYLAGMSLNTYDAAGIYQQILDYREYPDGLFKTDQVRARALRAIITGRLDVLLEDPVID